MKYRFVPVFLLLFVGALAHATTVRSLSLTDLVKGSEIIVKGRVTDLSSYFDAKRRMIYTKVRVTIDKTYMGRKSGDLVITLPGGTVDGRVQVVFGVPVLNPGEQVVLFLKSNHKRMGVVGLGQGVFIINPATNRVFRRLNRVRLVGAEFKFPTDLPGFERLLKTQINDKTGKK